MKIMMMDWNSFGREDIMAAFTRQGHEVVKFPFSKKEPRRDDKIQNEIKETMHRESPDVVFSFNYFPIIALVCKDEDVPYISWIYDSPYVLLYSYTTIFPTNHIFLFDRNQVKKFHDNRIMTVNYLPMAADAHRLSLLCDKASDTENKKYSADVSFVGSLYKGEHDFYGRMKNLSDYTHGYLEAVMKSQMQIYGADIVEECLTPDIIKDMQKALPMQTSEDGVETLSYLYGQYVIDREITARERRSLLGSVAAKYDLSLYAGKRDTGSEDTNSRNMEDVNPGCQEMKLCRFKNLGAVDYYTEAPLVYRNSKINLNITLRSIMSGMPLRVFEIMGSGGFLLTNYQADFEGSFKAGEDYVYFDSSKDLLDKCGYYLADSNNAERMEIAKNGFEKMMKYNTYDCRVREMLAAL